MRLTLLGLVYFATALSPAWAYIDPGSGSMIIQGLVGAIAAMMVFGRQAVFWIKVKLGLVVDNEKAGKVSPDE